VKRARSRAFLPIALLATGAALLLGACSKPVDETPAPAVAATPPPAPATVAPSLDLRGKAVVGKDGYGIVPCGESAQRILEIDPAAQPFLDKFLEGGTHEFFVEAETEPAAGGHLRVLRFHRLYTEGPGCEAPMNSMRFAAWGTEPFWAAIDAGEELRLERPGAEPLVARPSSAHQEGADWIVEGDTGAGKLSLRLTPDFCSDGMTDSLYAWKATASLGELQLKGCGFRGSGTGAKAP
jgi:putative lipoprotein